MSTLNSSLGANFLVKIFLPPAVFCRTDALQKIEDDPSSSMPRRRKGVHEATTSAAQEQIVSSITRRGQQNAGIRRSQARKCMEYKWSQSSKQHQGGNAVQWRVGTFDRLEKPQYTTR